MKEQEFETDFNVRLEEHDGEYLLEGIMEDVTRVDITITSGDNTIHITDLETARQPIEIPDPKSAEVTGSIYVTMTDGVKKPNYDDTIEYIPRSERPEWGPVGLLGKLWVYYAEGEDIVTGDYVTSDEDGNAIKCTFGDPDSHRVIDTNYEYGLVKVFYR